MLRDVSDDKRIRTLYPIRGNWGLQSWCADGVNHQAVLLDHHPRRTPAGVRVSPPVRVPVQPEVTVVKLWSWLKGLLRTPDEPTPPDFSHLTGPVLPAPRPLPAPVTSTSVTLDPERFRRLTREHPSLYQILRSKPQDPSFPDPENLEMKIR